MVKLNLRNNNGRVWREFPNGSVKGFAFVDNKFLSEEQMYCECIHAIENDALDNLLKKLNGSFSIVIRYHDRLFLIVDKLRSYPIFYTLTPTNTVEFITDIIEQDIYNARKKILFNEISVNEFLAKGYLSGNKTLLRDTFQIESGTYAIIYINQITVKQYHNYIIEKKNLKNLEWH